MPTARSLPLAIRDPIVIGGKADQYRSYAGKLSLHWLRCTYIDSIAIRSALFSLIVIPEGLLVPILLIDDDRDILDGTAALLQMEGYSAHAVDNGTTALAILRDGFRPDLIVLDLQMPGMTGFEFRDAQLRDERLAAIPVVVVTGYHETAADRERLGGVRILHKPLDPEILLALLSEHRVPRTA